MAFCESYVTDEMPNDKKWSRIVFVSVSNSELKMRCENVIFIITQLPFDVSQDDIVKYFEFEEIGECRKFKGRQAKVPQMTVTMHSDSVQTVIFKPTIIDDQNDPREVFTHDFLVGIGYLNPDGTAVNASKET
jgi:hypothetical protein